MGNDYERQDKAMPPPKKMLPLLILEILRKYTDQDHKLGQKDILDKLDSDYGMKVERKAIRANIANLIETGYPIEYRETEREGSMVWTDFWFSHEFDDAELRLLIDGLLFSNHIPRAQQLKLIKKIEGLSSENFHSHVKHVATLPDAGDANKQIFYNIAVIDQAISENRQVKFRYMYYGTDKQLHPSLNADGGEREYVINPYQMAAKEGKYYLICNNDKYENISNYRIDRIADIEILSSKRKPFKNLKNSNGMGFDLGEYMKEHIYMHHGGDVRVRFRVVNSLVTDVVDVFGKDVTFENEADGCVDILAKVNEDAMIRFAQSCAPDVVVLEPESLVEKMRKWSEDVRKAYGK